MSPLHRDPTPAMFPLHSDITPEMFPCSELTLTVPIVPRSNPDNVPIAYAILARRCSHCICDLNPAMSPLHSDLTPAMLSLHNDLILTTPIEQRFYPDNVLKLHSNKLPRRCSHCTTILSQRCSHQTAILPRRCSHQTAILPRRCSHCTAKHRQPTNIS